MKDPEFVREYEEIEPEYQIACAIIDAQIKNKITQKELAEKAGTSRNTVCTEITIFY